MATLFTKKEKTELENPIKTVSKTMFKPQPISRSNISQIQRTPQTILTKEQNILSELFGQKRQFWGNGQPVRIDKTLQTGYGLIKTGSGDDTRRLMF
jgi:hypothetical protein